MKRKNRYRPASVIHVPDDKGADGLANRVRPFGEIKRDRFTYAGYQDAHLIDRMHYRAQLTDIQHEAAQRVLEMHDAAGFEPKLVSGYAPNGWNNGHDDDTEEAAAIGRFRGLLGACSSAAAHILHAMCLEQHPGTMRLASLQAALDDLAKHWRMS